MSTPSASSACAMRSFACRFMEKPGACSPSRRLVSKMRTWSSSAFVAPLAPSACLGLFMGLGLAERKKNPASVAGCGVSGSLFRFCYLPGHSPQPVPPLVIRSTRTRSASSVPRSCNRPATVSGRFPLAMLWWLLRSDMTTTLPCPIRACQAFFQASFDLSRFVRLDVRMSIPSRPASGLRRPSQIKSFRAPPARELLLFCLSKREVTKRKRHPAWRLPPIPGRQVREPEPGFSAARPCTVEKASASCRCPLARPVVSVSPPHRGPTKRARSARTLRKARKPPCRSLATQSPHRVRARIGPPALRGPCAAVGLGREGPQGARQEVEHFSTVHGCAAEKPGPASRTSWAGCPGSAKRGGLSLGLLSLYSGHPALRPSGQLRCSHAHPAHAWPNKEKVTRAPEARETLLT